MATRSPGCLGFFIENIKDYIVRNGINQTSETAPDLKELNGTLAISEAMLKNPDWFVDLQRRVGQNVRIIFNARNQIIGFVPYDFDRTVYTRSSQHARWWEDDKKIREALSEPNDGLKALRTVVGNEAAIRSVFERSRMNDASKNLFRWNFDAFMAAARRHLD